MHNLATLNGKYCMNDDILTMIYNNVSIGGKYEYITSKEESNALILAVYTLEDLKRHKVL